MKTLEELEKTLQIYQDDLKHINMLTRQLIQNMELLTEERTIIEQTIEQVKKEIEEEKSVMYLKDNSSNYGMKPTKRSV